MPNDVNVRDITQVTVLDDTTDASALVEKNGTLYKAPYGTGGSGSGMDVAVIVDVTDSSAPTVSALNSTLTYAEMKAKIATPEPFLVQVIFSMTMSQGGIPMNIHVNSAMIQYMQVPSEMLPMFGLQDVDEAIGIVAMDQMTEATIAVALYDVDGVLTYTCVSIGS